MTDHPLSTRVLQGAISAKAPASTQRERCNLRCHPLRRGQTVRISGSRRWLGDSGTRRARFGAFRDKDDNAEVVIAAIVCDVQVNG
jgi:hypothetical protein